MEITRKETDYLRTKLVFNHKVESQKIGWYREESDVFNERLNSTYIDGMIFRKASSGGPFKVPRNNSSRTIKGMIKAVKMLNK